MVGNHEDKSYLKKYFKDIILVENNSNILDFYRKAIFSIIFLDFNIEKYNVFEISKKIREQDHQTIIILIAQSISKEDLLKALPLHLLGCIFKPFQEEQVKEVLMHINQELNYLSNDTIMLQENYYFHKYLNTLYSPTHSEIKLTKNELKLLNILIKAKDKLVSEESIEYTIWEKESFEADCQNRLKNLLYNIRKKLPKNSISNQYKLGYKLIHS